MDVFLVNLGREIAIREGFIILQAMYEKAGYSIKSATEGQLTKMDIRKAESWIKNKDGTRIPL